MLKRVASVALSSFAHRLIYFGSARGETLTASPCSTSTGTHPATRSLEFPKLVS